MDAVRRHVERRCRHDDYDDDDEGDPLDVGDDDESAAMVEAMLSQAGSEVNLARTLTKLVTKPRILVCTPSNAACDLLLEVCARACSTRQWTHVASTLPQRE
jgi:hypothetical protein